MKLQLLNIKDDREFCIEALKLAKSNKKLFNELAYDNELDARASKILTANEEWYKTWIKGVKS